MAALPALGSGGGGHARRSWRGAIAAGSAAAAAALVLPGCGAGQPGATAGSGVAAAQVRTVARFSGVDLTGSSNVTVTVGPRQSVVVHADRNLLRHITTRVVAGVLEIGTTGRFTTKVPMNVVVSVPSLTGLELSGSGQVTATGISARALSVSLPGSGSFDLSGTVTRLDVTLGGSGQAQLSRLTARDVHAELTGSGRIQVTATASLDAAVPGSGTISYGGDPAQVRRNVTGSGSVDRS
jgi:hypothetical protein